MTSKWVLCVLFAGLKNLFWQNQERRKTGKIYEKDRFTTCFKTCGTGSLFRGMEWGFKFPLMGGWAWGPFHVMRYPMSKKEILFITCLKFAYFKLIYFLIWSTFKLTNVFFKIAKLVIQNWGCCLQYCARQAVSCKPVNGFEQPNWNTLLRCTLIIRVIKVPSENDMVYGVFYPYILIDEHHVNGIIDLTDRCYTVIPIKPYKLNG